MQAGQKNKGAELERIVERWEQRYEWRLLSKTVPRSLIAALLLSLLIGAVGYFRLRLTSPQLALITAGLCGLGFIANLLYTLLFPRPLPTRARYFDLAFGLQERVSTAFELMSGRIKTHPELEARQIADALTQARAIDPRAQLALDFRLWELRALFVLALLTLGLILLPGLIGADFSAAAPPPALAEAREDLQEIIETVAKDTDLDDIDREQLLEDLQLALERLQEEDISDEEAFAALSQLQAQLEERETALGDTIELDQSTMAAAQEALADFLPPAETENAAPGEPPADLPTLSQSLQELAQEAAQMSAEEIQAAQEALRQAADELAQMDSALAEQMQEMADALEENDTEGLQEGLDAAQAQIEEEQQQNQREQNAQNMLQEQAQRAQDAAEAIAQRQAEEGGQQNAEPQPGQSEASETGQQRSGQQGQQQSAQTQQGASQGNQAPERNQPGIGEANQQNQDSRSAGAGAGQGEPNNRSLPGSGGEDQGADTNNQTTGQGEIAYEAIYNPSGISGGGREEIRLETDASDESLAEGDFDDNPLGESRVSYATVFSDYQNAANRALESDYVPLGLRDVVREYFTSLEPATG